MIPRSVGRRRLLVIEAEPVTAADLQFWLHSDFIDVEVVPSASDALTSMARRPADLVMTSTLLPPWEAAQLTAYLRSIAGRQPQVINAPYFTDSVDTAAARRGILRFFRPRRRGLLPQCAIATLRRQVTDYLRDEITNRAPLNDRLEGTPLTGQLVPVRALASDLVEPRAALPALVAREDRRGGPRMRLPDLPWLRALRVPNISKVEVVDLSRTGMQIETATKLTTGSWVEIELVGADLAMRMPARVLRTQIASVAPVGVRYRVAAAFAGPLDMRGLVPGGVAGAATISELLEKCATRSTAGTAAIRSPGSNQRCLPRSSAQAPVREVGLGFGDATDGILNGLATAAESSSRRRCTTSSEFAFQPPVISESA